MYISPTIGKDEGGYFADFSGGDVIAHRNLEEFMRLLVEKLKKEFVQRAYVLHDYWRDVPLVTFLTEDRNEAYMLAYDFDPYWRGRCDLRPVERGVGDGPQAGRE